MILMHKDFVLMKTVLLWASEGYKFNQRLFLAQGIDLIILKTRRDEVLPRLKM